MEDCSLKTDHDVILTKVDWLIPLIRVHLPVCRLLDACDQVSDYQDEAHAQTYCCVPNHRHLLRFRSNTFQGLTLHHIISPTMATSAYPSLARQDPRTQVIAHSALKVAQTASMIFPPLYLLSSLILRRGPGFSIRGLLRSGNRSVVGGASVGALAAWARLRNEPMEAIEDRCYRLVSVWQVCMGAAMRDDIVC